MPTLSRQTVFPNSELGITVKTCTHHMKNGGWQAWENLSNREKDGRN
ncbi:uncharacterized protein RSE6_04905 [Rhynchosporium secalis]|uniref:Uncharacterized protein n=1 Tax=Rhynchosporium secalis TaxID=38038 RepID=A0A1E1M6J2_RHYSE|nr:uncharacterized protein RSE6_04905 [Rhynchosporium secalis]